MKKEKDYPLKKIIEYKKVKELIFQILKDNTITPQDKNLKIYNILIKKE